MEDIDWRCETPGCPFAKDVDRRNGRLHRCCCSKCARGAGHSRRKCRKMLVAHAAFSPPFITSENSSSSTVDNSARPASFALASNDVPYGTHEVPQAVVRHSYTSNSSIRRETFFRIPERYCWMEGSVIEYMSFFSKRYKKNLSDDAVFEWEALEKYLKRLGSKKKHVEIHAFPIEECPADIPSINLYCGFFSGCDARGAGNMTDLTGCCFEVMAELITFPSTPLALRIAIADIEMFQLERFAFLCTAGKHRSVALVCLLAMIYYNDARLGFHKKSVLNHADITLDFCD